MIENSSPTRAETADVANAIFDGADAVMLSGETAVGAYPVKAVESMQSTSIIAENSEYYSRGVVDLCLRKRYAPHSICEAAAWASRDMGGAPVLVFTRSGDTALYMSKIRNQSPIYAFSPSRDIVNMLACAWNLSSFEVPYCKDLLACIRSAEQILLTKKLVKKGSTVVVISGTTNLKGATNLLRIKKIGDI
jgi:pyruvate kinase